VSLRVTVAAIILLVIWRKHLRLSGLAGLRTGALFGIVLVR